MVAISKLSFKIILLEACLISFFFVFSTVSLAKAALYYVTAKDNSSLGLSAYGTNGYNYVMSSPTIRQLHVSSLYVYKDRSDFAEVGWCWHLGMYRPNFFGAYKKNGTYREIHFDQAPPGTNHYYTVRNVSGTTSGAGMSMEFIKISKRTLGSEQESVLLQAKETVLTKQITATFGTSEKEILAETGITGQT